ncbi:uncharacterized protein STEHIDRAFT_112402 [Stereum hirsutum FP-91666 SS1]|uniref:uncharacterized protein n=1 Tax=Stereum hirsutum (strain FP-91666) TaxID=721885 RepID=UPI0004449C6F|nr:uncharacterized protein STEHIDRAFT_112402 [Stereum hirsutum FP-91666 SS1]EIM84868.1 hypothetical protein STEHIDRAFT_112402 [Stereum hirsutum FP-91666 SS1]
MSTYTIIVDDRDSAIVYSPHPSQSGGRQIDGWVCLRVATGLIRSPASSATYLGTVTQSGMNGSSLTYTFLGTSISAWAAINGSNINTDIIYALDDGIPTLHTVESETADVTLSHQNIFTIDSLSITTNHTIEITILTQTNSSNFLFDYFLIETASNFSIKNSPASVLLIDDTSPYLEYSSEADWTNNTPYLNDNNVMNASSKGAMKEGATLSFSFTGWAVIVYGISLNSTAPVATYTLDGGVPTGVRVTPHPGAWVNFAFISATFPLSREEQQHTLEITASEPNQFYLDYITVQSSKAYIPSLSPTQSNESASSTSMSINTATSPASVHHSHVTSIVGSVVPVILCIIALAALSVCIWRRRSAARRKTVLRETIDPMLLVHGAQRSNVNEATSETITPFILPPTSAMPSDPKRTTNTRDLPITHSRHTSLPSLPSQNEVSGDNIIDISAFVDQEIPFMPGPPPSYATA